MKGLKMKIVFVKMGANLDSEYSKISDMKSYRIRPTLNGDSGSEGCHFKDKDGNYIAGDFMCGFNGKLQYDFTNYGKDNRWQDMKRYELPINAPLNPTMANIKQLLQMITGEKIEIAWA